MTVVRIRLALVTIGLALLIPAVARASLAGDQQQGQNLIAQLQSGAKTCRDLSAGDLDHIGEYVMLRALGSTTLHQAMNDRMIAMLGEQGESRIHQLLGARYARCTTSASATGGCGGMMGGGGTIGALNPGGSGAMMNSSNWSWIIDRSVANVDPPRLAAPPTPTPRHQHQHHHGWSVTAMMVAVIVGLVLVTVAIAAIIRRPFRRPPAASTSL